MTRERFWRGMLGGRELRKTLSGNRGTAIYRYNPVATEDAAQELMAFLAAHID